jgi:hypothetical protein
LRAAEAGPADDTDRLGGYEWMLSPTETLAITTDQRFRFASWMSLALTTWVAR